ncbi:MAG: thioredoxin family protein [Emcibacteraceae bacterium]|nr:thioredoxin family protein [Emcibacteraceae bacterium]
MTFRNILQYIFVTFLITLFASGYSVAEVVRTDLSKIEMRADHSSVSAGDNFYIVIELTPDMGWHAYWENPGDAGLKLEMKWDLPPGVEIGDLQFTTPHLIPFEEIASYGYDGKVTIIAEASVSENIDVSELNIVGEAFWLICSDALCVPQDTTIGVKLSVGESIIDQRMDAVVQLAKADMPIVANWQSEFYSDGENFIVKSSIPDQYPVIESAYLFPHTEGMMENIYTQDLSFVNGEIIGRFKNAYGYVDNEEFKFLLTFKTGEGAELAYFLSAKKSITPITEPRQVIPELNMQAVSDINLGMALLFSFLGGLILNLMPCVFPILSLKAMSVVGLANKEPSEARLSGLLYTGGVMVCFGLIGALVLVLSATGLAVGWGFHMQLPIVNFILGLLMIVIALNLFGVFEFGRGLTGLGQGLIANDNTDKNKLRRNTFFTGFLAVVVATPCTAPFMAGALGFAFIEGGISAMLVFLLLGFGLAFPYLLICYIPGVRHIFPKPGSWMENMKNILGFPMLATAVWLFWILGNQIGVDAMALCVIASVLLSFALWGFWKKHITWKIASILCVLGVGYIAVQINDMDAGQNIPQSDKGELETVDYSSDELLNLLGQKKSVFVYFTADWCVTCKLNERIALSKPDVNNAFKAKNITVMKGDWTNQNPDITRTLRKYGRIGVPLYLYFPSGASFDSPVILPQILTPNIVIEAL